MIGTIILAPRGGCVQVQPGSTVQFWEHPSPLMVLPSSHCSGGTTMPSPHFEVQDAPLQLGSIWQSSEQPSKGMVLPSSQPSAPSTLPLPQVLRVQTLG